MFLSGRLFDSIVDYYVFVTYMIVHEKCFDKIKLLFVHPVASRVDNMCHNGNLVVFSDMV